MASQAIEFIAPMHGHVVRGSGTNFWPTGFKKIASRERTIMEHSPASKRAVWSPLSHVPKAANPMESQLKGRLRNTPLPFSRSLTPVFEAVVNSIQAIEDEGNGNERRAENFVLKFTLSAQVLMNWIYPSLMESRLRLLALKSSTMVLVLTTPTGSLLGCWTTFQKPIVGAGG